ncbi:hypothetical protein LPJ66_004888 [Kickxella alabastrina]|uniref:Uncharacterized protein n=1 Tax=Kickxella alabastrina TaxID=61397 RepID=A0ACC1IN94_9FUNG|nr:hypothetical protein LPJ66_004888 [Kickxella alabastrina]
MANQSAKRITQENAARLAILSKLLLGINGFYLFVRIILQYKSLTWSEAIMYLGSVALEVFLYTNLQHVSRPRYDPGGVLIDSGTDLSQPGLVSYMFDYIYISWFVHLLSLATRWAWFLYLTIPVYLGYMLFPYIRQFLGSSLGQQGGNPEEKVSEEDAAKEKKRKEKKERKQQRVKYSR